MDEQTKKYGPRTKYQSLSAALNGGEDYELLFTVPVSDYDKVKIHPDITIIGHIADARRNRFATGAGSEIELMAQGWNPLKE